METQTLEHRSQAEIFEDFDKLTPTPIKWFVAQNAAEQKALFLNGEIDTPQHYYNRLENLDLESDKQKLLMILEEIKTNPNINEKFKPECLEVVQSKIDTIDFVIIAQKLNFAELRPRERAELEAQYMQFNLEKYKPNKSKYFSHLKEKLDKYSTADLSQEDQLVYAELVGLLPALPSEIEPRFKPTDEAIEFATTVAEVFYEPLLDLIPEKPEDELYSPAEIQEVFIKIVREIFGDNWEIQLVAAASINVEAKNKIVKIPIDRKPVTYKELRSLVAHELGVHYLRSVMGETTDFPLLRTGISDYYDQEEGTGISMGGLVNGEIAETGANRYIAGITSLHNDFRDTFEIMWRIHHLDSVADSTNQTRKSCEDEAYKTTARFFRGAGLPWLKDLSYDDGKDEFWRYMQENIGDDFAIFLLFAGKNNPAKHTHRRIILETATPAGHEPELDNSPLLG